MTRILIFLGATLGSWIGWEIGDRWGLMTATVLSGILGCVGVYAGWRAAREWVD